MAREKLIFRTSRSPMVILIILMMLLGMACSGEEGPAGPAGSQGPAGPAGPAGSAGFGQVSAVGDLAVARGVVYDWSQTWDEKNDTRNWLTNGEWSLNCQVACAKAKPEQVKFDMAIAMVRAEVEEAGKSSHGHTFWGFQATSVEVVPGDKKETLEIKGTITGSGPLGTDGITIKLVKADNGHFTFFFKLDEGNVLTTEVGGGVLESSG